MLRLETEPVNVELLWLKTPSSLISTGTTIPILSVNFVTLPLATQTVLNVNGMILE